MIMIIFSKIVILFPLVCGIIGSVMIRENHKKWRREYETF